MWIRALMACATFWLASPAAAITFTTSDGAVVTGGSELATWRNDDQSTWTGQIVVEAPNGNRLEGQFLKGFWHGVVKETLANGLVKMAVYDKGALLSEYFELEADLVLGRFDAVYEKRGDQPLMGVAFGDATDAGQPSVTIDTVMYNSPADMAGIRSGDRVIQIGGKRPSSKEEAVAAVASVSHGQALSVTIERTGKTQELTVYPHVIPDSHAAVAAGNVVPTSERLWQSIQQRPSLERLEAYIREVSDPRRIEPAKKLYSTLQAQQPAAQASALADGTLEALAAYAAVFDTTKFRGAVDARIAEMASGKTASLEVFDTYRLACRGCLAAFPEAYGVLLQGPGDLSVRKVLIRQHNGESPKALLNAVQQHPLAYFYPELDEQERALLIRLGMDKKLVEKIHELGYQDRLYRERIHASGKPAAAAVSDLPRPAGKAGPVAQCMKLTLALALCDQLVSFSATACRAVVQKKLQCSLP